MTQDILITPGSGEPQILFRGSGTNDTPIELNVLSSYQSATGSGTALVFEGQEGQLFAVTDNLSSGTIFSVGDITGLSMLSVDASGDVKLGEFANSVIVYPGLTLDDNVPSTTSNVLYNDGGDLMWNGVTVVESGATQAVDGSGTASYVARFTDTNTLGTGIIYDNGTNVGIGTASPSQKLTIADDNAPFLRFDRTGAGRYDFEIGMDSSADLIFRGGGDATGAGLTEYMRIKSGHSSLGYYNGGDVGIGTASPSQKLDIRYPAGGGMALLKSTDTTDGLLFGDMAYSASNDLQGMKHASMGGINDFMIISNGSDTILSSKAGANTYIRSGGNGVGLISVTASEIVVNDEGTSTDFRVESDNDTHALFVDGVTDNVGIGTYSPAYKLQIQQNLAGSSLAYVYNTNTSSSSRAGFNCRANNTLTYLQSHGEGGIVNRYGFALDAWSELWTTNASGIAIGPGSSDSPIVFGNNSTERMRIAAGGNVGIGTTSPADKLHVVGDVTIGTGSANDSVRNIRSGGCSVIEARDANHRIIIRGTQDTSGAITGNTNNIDFYEYGDFNFYTNVNTAGSARTHTLTMTAGNVGIGTTSPQQKLHIDEGNIRIEKTTDPTIEFNNGSANRASMFYDTSEETFVLNHTDADANQLVLTSGNNVGIGTNDPNATLHVYSATSGENVFNVEGTNGSLFGVTDNLSGVLMSVNTIAGLPVLEVNSDYSLTAGRFNQNDFAISSSGNVGIGTASPSQKLHVVGSGYIDDLSIGGVDTFSSYNLYAYGPVGLFGNTKILGSNSLIFEGGAVDRFTIAHNYLDSLRFNTDLANNALVIARDGNVGIGTSSVTQKLDIRYPAGGGMALLKSTDTTDGLLFGDMAYSTSNTYQGIKHAGMTGVNDYMMISEGYNTLVSSKSDGITFIRGGGNNGNSQISLKSTEVVVNENGSNLDFRVASDNDANMLFVDGVANRVGIGTALPSYTLDITGSLHSTATTRLDYGFYSSGANSGGGTAVPSQGQSDAYSISKLQLYQASSSNGSQWLQFGRVNAGNNQSAAWIGVTYDYNYASNLQFYTAKKGNNTLNPYESSRSMVLSQDFISMYTGPAGTGTPTERVRINSAGNVGIGETTPTQKLHVAGNLRLTGAFYDSNNAAGTSGQVLSSTATGTDWISLSEIQGVDGTGGAGQVAFWSDADTITGESNLYWDSSNDRLGIGTSSPTETLEVEDHSTNPVYAKITNSYSTGKAGIKLTTTYGGTEYSSYIWDDWVGVGTVFQASRDLNTGQGGFNWLAANGSSMMSLRRNGGTVYGLGVGGVNALVPLHVKDRASGSDGIRIDYGSDSSYNLRLDGVGGIRQWRGTGSNGGMALITSLTSGSWGGDQGGAIAFQPRDTEAARFDGLGNFGIGTASPAAKLDVNGQVRIDSVSVVPTSCKLLVGDVLHTTSGSVAQFGGSLRIKTGLLIHDNTTVGNAFYLNYVSADGLKVSRTEGTGSQNILLADTGGNVGIGTASPINNLQIGTTTATATSSPVTLSLGGTYSSTAGANPKFKLYQDASNNNYGFGVSSNSLDYIAPVSTNSHNFYVGGSHSVRITQTSLGIGTTNPQQELHVVGDQRIENATDPKLEFHDGAAVGGYVKFDTSEDNLVLSHVDVAGDNQIALANDGNVGIGTASPNAVLHAYGSTPSGTVLNVEGTNGSLFSVVDNLSGVLMSVNNNAGLPVFEVNDDDSIVAGRFAQDDFVVSTSGDIGMGTATPVSKLDVSGVITATGGNSTQWNAAYDWVAASGASAGGGSPNNGTLTMNTSGTGLSGSATFTADQSGNSTFTVASNATSANTASTIVARDSSGNFSAGTITATQVNVDNLRLDGNTLSSTNTNGALILNPNGTGALQADSGGNARGAYAVDLQRLRGNAIQVASGACSFIGGGRGNTASNIYTTAVGGRFNSASSNYASVVGGNANASSGAGAFIGGGISNGASNRRAVIAGGQGNSASNCYASITGGIGNTASGHSSFVGGGRSNTASGLCSTVSGGYNNIASQGFSTISGGSGNCASGCCSTVSGGYCNCASGNSSTIGGGGGLFFGLLNYGNTASGNYSTVSGGYLNCASQVSSTVSGGSRNCASGSFSTVSGGIRNTASGSYSTASGGNCNCATGFASTIIGGLRAKATSYGEVAHAAGQFAQKGDAQHSTFVARKNTTDATANVELFLDSSSQRMTLTAETTWTFDIKLSAYNDTDNTTAWWIIRGGIRRNAANGTTLIGSLIEERDYEGTMSGTSAAVTADDTNESLKIAVTGLASKNIRWVAVVDVAQVSWGTP